MAESEDEDTYAYDEYDSSSGSELSSEEEGSHAIDRARKSSDSEPLTFSREEMAVVKHMHGQVSDLNTSVWWGSWDQPEHRQ